MATNLTIPPGMQRVFIGIPVDKQSQQRINELLRPIKNHARIFVGWLGTTGT
jgi:2'-5' RNA ligase